MCTNWKQLPLYPIYRRDAIDMCSLMHCRHVTNGGINETTSCGWHNKQTWLIKLVLFFFFYLFHIFFIYISTIYFPLRYFFAFFFFFFFFISSVLMRMLRILGNILMFRDIFNRDPFSLFSCVNYSCRIYIRDLQICTCTRVSYQPIF